MGTNTLRLSPSSKLHKLRAQRHRNGRDLKCVITQRDSETGGGKTTLAVFLALSWDTKGWDGDKKGTVHPEEFLSTYPDLPKHSVLVLDEAEELDARRSMQQENIDFSKHWMTMRTRQVDTILTLPTTSALDKRLLELADIRINVIGRGRAKVYRVKVDDHAPDNPEQWYLEDIEWPDMSGHPDYQALDAQKQAMIDREAEEESENRDPTATEIAEEIRDDWDHNQLIKDINHGTQQAVNKSAIQRKFSIGSTKVDLVKDALREMGVVDDDVL
jgi:hypothetical protein